MQDVYTSERFSLTINAVYISCVYMNSKGSDKMVRKLIAFRDEDVKVVEDYCSKTGDNFISGLRAILYMWGKGITQSFSTVVATPSAVNKPVIEADIDDDVDFVEPTKAAYRPVDSKVFSAGIDLDDKEEDASGNTARDYYDQLVSDFESDKQSIIISEKQRLMKGEITGIQLDGYTRFFEEVTAIVEHQNKGEA